MSFWSRWVAGAWAAMILIAVNGCSPSDQAQQDEEKEPHFVLGNSRFNGMDYDGAIEAFQQSLEINPRSGQAHYRLAQIFDSIDKHRSDPAAAIYHYQEYLRLDTHAENADVVRGHILSCKQQLAADVMSMPTAPRTLRQIEELTETNRLLQAQVDRLTDSVKQWSAYATTLQAAATRNNSVPQNNSPAPTLTGGGLTPDDVSTPTPTTRTTTPRMMTSSTRPPASGTNRARTHVVASGETMASIARKSGVSLTALQAANPGVTPRKLRAGQTLNLP